MVDSASLFDPNEKDPVMRALNMVKEYCNVSIREIMNSNTGTLSASNLKIAAYQDVIDFIEDHQRKCGGVKNRELEHGENGVEWYRTRMQTYRDSFFRVCDIVKHSDCADIIKELIEDERRKY